MHQSVMLALSLLALPLAAEELPRVELTAGFYRIDAEVAANYTHPLHGVLPISRSFCAAT